ncbi:PDR/VanB family oxidoreductase [Bradyrhizobium sp. Ai1a-2]|uniref:PDR/VanB family oxidoreductase n=1 Tax=Bradyrhizobium sp. Ai1a-2 TaxID=196490 RepID=UPI000424ACE0|nr:PDR/VanB family oxidoreductase [Bradyrhizobium sp. Ai1a-2]
MTETWELTIEAVKPEAEDVKSFVLGDPAGRPLPAWTPGSHIDVVTPEGLTAQYSLCGGVRDRHWRIAALLKRDGKGVSRYLHEKVQAGDILRASSPRNHFRLATSRSYVFIAGGIGITPILPMIAEVSLRGLPWRLFYGGRQRTSMAFLAELVRYGDRVQVLPESEHGLLPLPELIGTSDTQDGIYCCGPEPLIRAVEALAHNRGLPKPHVERFNPTDTAHHANDGGFEVELAKTGQIIPVTAQQTILEALEQHGICPPASCREGVCGTCEAAVLAGQIDHRDSVLTDDEREVGRSMMICVSRARSAKLKLDL